jgi:hypothetical protein
MRTRRLVHALVLGSTVATTLVTGIPAASAHVLCPDGEYYSSSSGSKYFSQVDSIALVNTRSGTATLTANVSEAHTSSRSFTGTISGTVEGSFWVFAKASATASASVTLLTSSTITTSYTATVSVPGHSTRTVKFGFRKYEQYVKSYHYYNNSVSTCAKSYDKAGWVRAPYQKTFIVS